MTDLMEWVIDLLETAGQPDADYDLARVLIGMAREAVVHDGGEGTDAEVISLLADLPQSDMEFWLAGARMKLAISDR